MKRLSSLGLALLLIASPLWAHDGAAHKTEGAESGEQPKTPFPTLQSRQAPLSVDATPHADEEKARNYFTDLPLLTQEGKAVRFYSDVLRNRVVLINFIYTNCDQGCPVITSQLVEVKNRLGERFGSEVYFVSISTDAERDTPEALKAFAVKNGADHPGWIFLTGDKRNVDRILTKLGQYSPVPEEHSSLLLAGNVKTRHWIKLRPNAPLPALVFKLNDLADETAADAAVP